MHFLITPPKNALVLTVINIKSIIIVTVNTGDGDSTDGWVVVMVLTLVVVLMVLLMATGVISVTQQISCIKVFIKMFFIILVLT